MIAIVMLTEQADNADCKRFLFSFFGNSRKQSEKDICAVSFELARIIHTRLI